jgi:hypothetical protein
MAVQVLTNAYAKWGSTDMSDHVRSLTLSYSAESIDDTAMGDTTRSATGGLKAWNADIEWFADEAANEPSRILFTAGVGTTATLAIKPVVSATSTANPVYTGTALCTSIEPVAGEVGAMQMLRATFVSAGALSRSTS